MSTSNATDGRGQDRGDAPVASGVGSAHTLPHSSASQAQYGRAIDWRTEPIRAGDLIFHRGSVPVHDNGHVGIAISATHWIVAPKTGDVVSLRPIPLDRIQTVRRLVQPQE